MGESFWRKLFLVENKYFAPIVAATYLLGTIISYFKIDNTILSYIAGMSLISILREHTCSVVFKFCFYHRICLYYILVCSIINILDWIIVFPISDMYIITTNLITAFIFIAIMVYKHMKEYNIKIFNK